MKKVKIDQDGCIACGTCYALCPEVFEDDGSGTAQIAEEYRGGAADQGEAPDDIDCVEEAANGCPVGVITVS